MMREAAEGLPQGRVFDAAMMELQELSLGLMKLRRAVFRHGMIPVR